MTAPAPTPDLAATEPSPVGALSALIQAANDAGLSYQRMADQAIDPETRTQVSKQYLQKLVKTPPFNPPTAPQLNAIAAALRTSERRVKAAAAAQWLEYEATELAGYGEEVRIIVAHLAGKPPAEVRRWRRMIEASEQDDDE
jgi:protein-disulfide isomerase-like protein with CxxC motif